MVGGREGEESEGNWLDRREPISFNLYMLLYMLSRLQASSCSCRFYEKHHAGEQCLWLVFGGTTPLSHSRVIALG